MIALTTFSKTGYNEYAHRLLNSAIEHWPSDLIVYHEGTPPPIIHKKIKYRSLFDLPDLVAFLQHIQNLPMAHGKLPDGSYNYNYDAWKFCRKVFAQLDVLKEHKGKVFWLDADVVLHKTVPERFLDDLLEGRGLVYLGREDFYTETGFIGFDPQHQHFSTFLEKYEQCYRRGILFTLPRWHDCAAFDWAREHAPDIGRNLSDFYQHKKSPLNVLLKTPLAEYMTHEKGGRKFGLKKEPIAATG